MAYLASQSSIAVPIGTIIAYCANSWIKPKEEEKWLLCNGQTVDATKYPKLALLMSHVPDLRDRFLTGAGLMYTLGDIGGENTHTLTINEMPKHNHKTSNGYLVGAQNSGGGGPGHTGDPYPIKRNGGVDYTGNDEPHENRPPYYAVLYYIRAK